ncbi:MAG: hypothetical protein H9W81_13410 [Enterococcus sp.]|nr:hypothetical protein [Enterococcus sp.]
MISPELPAVQFFTPEETVINDETLTLDGPLGKASFRLVTILRVEFFLDEWRADISLHEKDEDSTDEIFRRAVRNKNHLREIIDGLAQDFPTISDTTQIMSKADLFFDTMNAGLMKKSRLNDTTGYCDDCGPMSDKYTFLFLPSMPGTNLTASSVSLIWEAGCYGGSVVEGEFSAVKNELLSTLEHMRSIADKDYARNIKDIMKFLAKQ